VCVRGSATARRLSLSALATLAFLSAPASAVAAPTVYAECSALQGGQLSRRVSERFCGWLLLRLLEEGYALVRDPLVASRELRVLDGNREFLLQASGAEQRAYAVPSSRGDVGVVELLHRAVEIVNEVGNAPTALLPASFQATAVVSTPGSDPEQSADLRAQVVQILSDKGVVVAPRPDEASTLLCVDLQSGDVRVAAVSSGAVCDTRQTNVTLIDDSAGLDRAVSKALKGVAVAAPEVVRDTNSLELPAPSLEPPPRGFDIGLGLGALARSGGFDPWLQLDASLPISGKWRVRADLGLSFAAAAGLRILEPVLQFGVFWSHVSPRIAVGVGLSGGARVHSYYFSDEDQGFRLNWLGSVPIEFGVRLSQFVAYIALQPGIASTPPTHLVRHEPVWHRGNLFSVLLIGVRGTP
jgi:hypothetical protein